MAPTIIDNPLMYAEPCRDEHSLAIGYNKSEAKAEKVYV